MVVVSSFHTTATTQAAPNLAIIFFALAKLGRIKAKGCIRTGNIALNVVELFILDVNFLFELGP
jgi:hypothetical protein